MKSFVKLLLVSFPFLINFSCKEFETDFIPEQCYRISEISVTDNLNGVEKKHSFTYKKNKLVECKTCFKDENNCFQESRKMCFQYKDNMVDVLLYRKQNDSWLKHQLFEFKIKNHCITEKVITRFSFPACQRCWKYTYHYQRNNLTEVMKYMKNASDEWNLLERTVFLYDEDNLHTYKHFMESEGGNVALDYVRKYHNRNGFCECWIGGIIIGKEDWNQTERMEYSYMNGLMFTQTYFRRINHEYDWQPYVNISYSYDTNDNLIERLTSNGNYITYKYELGKSNTEKFFGCFNETVKTDFLNL